jgi:glycine betaine/proline transport system substrate-binding protein
VIPEYGLKQTQKQSSTPAMLSEVDTRYKNQEPFIFIAWRPHWMNDDYSFNYLDDPKGALGDLTNKSTVSGIVRQGFPDDHPDAYALMKNMSLSEEQIVSVERANLAANNDPLQGARNWIKDNRDVVQPWVDAAKAAQ